MGLNAKDLIIDVKQEKIHNIVRQRVMWGAKKCNGETQLCYVYEHVREDP